MEYRRVGKSGLQVSALSLGSWLTYGTVVDQKQTDYIVSKAFDGGIIAFDTANCYSRGEAERSLGKAVASLPRDKVVISTKLFFGMGDGANQKGCSRKAVIEQLDASLKRLGLDYVDMLYFHRYDSETPVEETIRAIDDLVTQGKVLYYGTSEWSAAQISEAVAVSDRLNLDRMIVNQPKFSLLCRSMETEILPLCNEKGIGQIGFSPLAQGMLTGKYTKENQAPSNSRAASPQGNSIKSEYFSDINFERIARFAELSKQSGIPMNLLALKWAISKPGVASVIIGASRPEQVDDNLAVFNTEVPQEVLAKLEEIFPVL